MPSREQRVRVWRGEIKKTTGGLTKDDLVKNRKGKIVSRRKSRQAAEQNNLGEWLRNKGDRFEDMPQAHAAKGLKAPKPRPPKKAPEPKPVRPPPKRKRKPRYEDDDDWAPPGAKPKPKPKPLPVKAEPKPKALLPRPPKALPKPKLKPKQVKHLVHIAKKQKPKPKPKALKAKPKIVKAKPFRHKVDRDAGLSAGLRQKKKKPVKLHAREPQPEYVRFKEDLGRSTLKVRAPPELYKVRKDPIVESAPIARNKNARFAEVSVSNIRRRSRRRGKRVDYSKYFD